MGVKVATPRDLAPDFKSLDCSYDISAHSLVLIGAVPGDHTKYLTMLSVLSQNATTVEAVQGQGIEAVRAQLPELLGASHDEYEVRTGRLIVLIGVYGRSAPLALEQHLAALVHG